MKTLASLACLLLFLVLSNQTAVADIAKPKPPAQQPAQQPKVVMGRKLEIVPDQNRWQAQLQISQSDFQELRAAMEAAGGGQTGVAASIAQSPVRTIVAGVLLFLSVSFAGVWLARNSAGRARKAVAAGVLVAAVLGAAAIITRGNAGPPPGWLSWKDLPKNFSQGRPTAGQIMIVVVPDNPDSPSIKLLLPTKPKDGPAE